MPSERVPLARAADRMARRHGLATRAELRRLGVTDRQIDRMVSNRRWRFAAPGVLADRSAVVGPAQRLLATVLWAGPDAMAAAHSAAWLWQLTERPAADHAVLTIERRRGRAGVRLVRTSGAMPRRVVRDGIPCTTLVRTLGDCAACTPPAEFTRMLDRAVGAYPQLVPQLERALRPGGELARRRGAAVLRATMARRGYSGGVPRTVLETALHLVLVEAGAEGIEREHRVHEGGDTWYFDAALPRLRMLFEAQSATHHIDPLQLRRDARKANAAARAGWSLRTLTWHDLTVDRARTIDELRCDLIAAEKRTVAPTGTPFKFGG